MMRNTDHEHPLTKVDPNVVYQQYHGRWTCDGCRNSKTNTELPYHCSMCHFDLCDNCFQGHRHQRHPHPLFYSNMARVYPGYDGGWKCDHCGRNKNELQQSFGYHCPQDQFDLCYECFHGKLHPIHVHALKLSDSVQLYGQSVGLWQCDSCKRNGNQIGSRFCWHCAQCQFDACDSCMKDRKFPFHPHTLKITDSRVSYSDYNGAWKCDMCNRVGGQMIPSMDKSFHCAVCRYDVCFACVQRETGWLVGGGDETRDVPSYREPENSHIPSIVPGDDEEEPDESQRCVVCMARRKNATIVHGTTGHICCCIQCAITLKNNRDNCPICRAPISSVIRHYTS